MGPHLSSGAETDPAFNLQRHKQNQDRKGISAPPFQNGVTGLCAEDRVAIRTPQASFRCRLPVLRCTGTVILVNCFLPVDPLIFHGPAHSNILINTGCKQLGPRKIERNQEKSVLM